MTGGVEHKDDHIDIYFHVGSLLMHICITLSFAYNTMILELRVIVVLAVSDGHPYQMEPVKELNES